MGGVRILNSDYSFAIRSNVPVADFIDLVVSDEPDRPNCLCFLKDCGIVAFEFSSSIENDRNLRKVLNRKIIQLQSDAPELDSVPMSRVLVSYGPVSGLGEVPKETVTIESKNLADGDWYSYLPKTSSEFETLASFSSGLKPETLFTKVAKVGSFDEGKKDRAEIRIRLDDHQEAIAKVELSDVLVVDGPPGSGKTLVLVARARWLALRNPDWRIGIICYNTSLVDYLAKLLEGYANVEVSTFNGFTRSLGFSFTKSEEGTAIRELRKARSKGIDQVFDALLIDEWQDFCPSWVTLCLELLKPNRGGIVFAGDAKQAIYQEQAPSRALVKRNVGKVELLRPYRTTRQILQFVSFLEEDFSTIGCETSLEGEPVNLIHAGSWDEQAEAAVWETNRLIISGERKPEEIGILCTRRSLVGRVKDDLWAKEIPFRLLGSRRDPDESDSENAVCVSTIHAAKGLEFNVVILLGLDAVQSLDQVDEPQKSRIGYVGPTRAKDLLIATFTKSTPMISRLRDCPSELLTELEYPDDFEQDR